MSRFVLEPGGGRVWPVAGIVLASYNHWETREMAKYTVSIKGSRNIVIEAERAEAGDVVVRFLDGDTQTVAAVPVSDLRWFAKEGCASGGS